MRIVIEYDAPSLPPPPPEPPPREAWLYQDSHGWVLLVLDPDGFEDAGRFGDLLYRIIDLASRGPVTLRLADPYADAGQLI